MKALALSLAVVFSSAPAAFAADVTAQPTLTLDGAKHAVAAAIDYARAHGAPGAPIAVVDAEAVYRSDGTLYFTDRSFDPPKFFDDRRKQLRFSPVFCWKDSRVHLEIRELKGPNGIVFSPKEKCLYLSNSLYRIDWLQPGIRS